MGLYVAHLNRFLTKDLTSLYYKNHKYKVI